MITITAFPEISEKELKSITGTWEYIEHIVSKTYELLEKDKSDYLHDKVTVYQVTLMKLGMIYPCPDLPGLAGGFMAVIKEGLGEYLFENDFAECLHEWGFQHLSSIVRKANAIYESQKAELEQEMSIDDLYEYYNQFPELELLGDEFEYYMGEEYVNIIEFVQNNIRKFAIVV
jgi:hypothetical protein